MSGLEILGQMAGLTQPLTQPTLCPRLGGDTQACERPMPSFLLREPLLPPHGGMLCETFPAHSPRQWGSWRNPAGSRVGDRVRSGGEMRCPTPQPVSPQAEQGYWANMGKGGEGVSLQPGASAFPRPPRDTCRGPAGRALWPVAGAPVHGGLGRNGGPARASSLSPCNQIQHMPSSHLMPSNHPLLDQTGGLNTGPGVSHPSNGWRPTVAAVKGI